MKAPEANQLIVKIQKTLDKGLDAGKVVPLLKELRPFALAEEDPLVTKVIRMAYEHIAANESFQFMSGFEDNDIEPEEGEEIEEVRIAPGEDHDNLNYLLELLKKSDNKFNREEIKDFRTQLKEF